MKKKGKELERLEVQFEEMRTSTLAESEIAANAHTKLRQKEAELRAELEAAEALSDGDMVAKREELRRISEERASVDAEFGELKGDVQRELMLKAQQGELEIKRMQAEKEKEAADREDARLEQARLDKEKQRKIEEELEARLHAEAEELALKEARRTPIDDLVDSEIDALMMGAAQYDGALETQRLLAAEASEDSIAAAMLQGGSAQERVMDDLLGKHQSELISEAERAREGVLDETKKKLEVAAEMSERRERARSEVIAQRQAVANDEAEGRKIDEMMARAGELSKELAVKLSELCKSEPATCKGGTSQSMLEAIDEIPTVLARYESLSQSELEAQTKIRQFDIEQIEKGESKSRQLNESIVTQAEEASKATLRQLGAITSEALAIGEGRGGGGDSGGGFAVEEAERRLEEEKKIEGLKASVSTTV